MRKGEIEKKKDGKKKKFLRSLFSKVSGKRCPCAHGSQACQRAKGSSNYAWSLAGLAVLGSNLVFFGFEKLDEVVQRSLSRVLLLEIGDHGVNRLFLCLGCLRLGFVLFSDLEILSGKRREPFRFFALLLGSLAALSRFSFLLF